MFVMIWMQSIHSRLFRFKHVIGHTYLILFGNNIFTIVLLPTIVSNAIVVVPTTFDEIVMVDYA